jgi:hypothetical protein
MKAFLLFLSSLLTFTVLHAQCEATDGDSILSRQRYSFTIETKKAAVTGILIAKEDQATIYGSMINEFGISAIDFIYTKAKAKVKLINVVSFLNKWYIKLVLKNDLKFCLHELYGTPYTAKHKYQVTTSGDTLCIVNSKRHLKYLFVPLTIADENDSE